MEGEGEEEEMEVELVFEAREVDPEYEFDAPMFFDFTREESFLESRAAEGWFDTAPTYPPSPFVARLVWREETSVLDGGGGGGPDDRVGPALSGIDTIDKGGYEKRIGELDSDCEGMYRRILASLQSNNTQQVPTQLLESATGPALFHHLPMDKAKTNVSSTMKPNLSRSSTLMKPTASMLAKQNRASSRFQMPLAQKERGLCNHSGVESQATKRQKLEGGHLLKVGEAKQQTDYIHKAPKRNGNANKASIPVKLRITIPREPDLVTANRAKRIRPNGIQSEQVTVTERGFKARPLNRKILAAPSLPLHKRTTPRLPDFQEFHLKTSERAMQQTSSVPSSLTPYSDFHKGLDEPGNVSAAEIQEQESRRPSTLGAPKQEGCSAIHVFKARPLNKKIFLSKGEIGVFRNVKHEVTVPMEFNLQTERRIQNPPVELFSKLSLTSEVQPNNRSQLQLSQLKCTSTKGSKENRVNLFQTKPKMTLPVKERLHAFGGKQIQNENGDSCMKEVGNHLSTRYWVELPLLDTSDECIDSEIATTLFKDTASLLHRK